MLSTRHAQASRLPFGWCYSMHLCTPGWIPGMFCTTKKASLKGTCSGQNAAHARVCTPVHYNYLLVFQERLASGSIALLHSSGDQRNHSEVHGSAHFCMLICGKAVWVSHFFGGKGHNAENGCSAECELWRHVKTCKLTQSDTLSQRLSLQLTLTHCLVRC